MSSLVSRSLKHLRDREETCMVDKCERWIPGANIRRDLFLLFDLIWLSMNINRTYGQICGIQVTDAKHLAEHMKTIQKSPIAPAWVACNGVIIVHCWAKVGPRGKRKLWTLTEHEVSLWPDNKGRVKPWVKPNRSNKTS